MAGFAAAIPAIGGLVGDLFGFLGSGRAAKSISDAYIAAEHGVLGAVDWGKQNVGGAITAGQGTVNQSLLDAIQRMTQAGNTAAGAVGGATSDANNTLQNLLTNMGEKLNPYLQAGGQGISDLAKYASGGGPKFSFNYDDYKNSDAYKFQLEQGQQAINNQMAARGLANSGATLKELTNYGQGLASTYYNDAFNRAQQTFQTNQNTTLSNLLALSGQGLQATNQLQGAEALFGAPQAQNTLNAGYYTGNTNMGIAQLLSQLGMQGSEFNANLGVQGNEFLANQGLLGSQLAGNYAVGAGTAHAGGILGQNQAITGGLTDILGLISMFLPGSSGGVGNAGMPIGSLPGVGSPIP